MTMSELEQLRSMLRAAGPDERTYWNDERAPTYNGNGIRLATEPDGDRHLWRVVRVDGSHTLSQDSFPTRVAAKADMRKFLEELRSKLEDEEDVGPASVGMYPG
jgi:hypothetical protein